MTDNVRAFLRERIAENRQTTGDWPRGLSRDRGVAWIHGNELECWFLGEDGTVYSADRDAAAPRLEPVGIPGVARQIIADAAVHFPVLKELLLVPLPELPGGPKVASPDGAWVAHVAGDWTEPDGDVSVVTLFNAATRARVRFLQVRVAGLRPVRFLGPQRILLSEGDGPGTAHYELDYEAEKCFRRVSPSDVRDDYAPGELACESSLASLFVFLWAAGLALLLPNLWAVSAALSGNVAGAISVAALSLLLAWGLFRLAVRPRVVGIASDGTVTVQWGRRHPFILSRVAAQKMETLEVVGERRFALSPRAGGNTGVQSRPARFRVIGQAAGRRLDLGSHATAEAAENAARRLRVWMKPAQRA